MLKDKHILLCVSGGIAVYKAVALTSKLTQAGALVKVIMSESAQKFVNPLSFQALSGHDVFTDTFDEKDSSVIAHIDLADWADLVIVAPATANVIGKMANGIADDMLTTTLLATEAPIWVAPAMNVNMYNHSAVKRNLHRLCEDGVKFIEPSEGFLACGYVGKGRLEEPEKIVEHLNDFFQEGKPTPLEGKKVLVTAGPTRESIDPVRYFTNHSTGKMGFSLAKQAAKMGAHVTLITGPTTLDEPQGINIVKVETADEMFHAVMERFHQMDIVVKAAAVADYKPKQTYTHKMKKSNDELVISFERTKDILLELGRNKQHQILVGFAAESEQLETYAMRKLKKKNLDMIVGNNILLEGAGFQGDTNIVEVFTSQGKVRSLPMMNKSRVAEVILQEITTLMMGV
ncbi:bifunctional phosphopantothenoylcysteine decarboxylase/phosphopantothenate--cysteine ligase CoaBC [Bacillus carboniphilus]|uniref:Coenzyme A biosynthesis bifunctional protein CoaBC n=1 Tax=Bacillus carboniphilus TaxID=86663 RepID=A0ABY9K165_9BACI|nr:bifunctional phosphopantothenoylcysteine decarboxylase/phosphopantothenate--cysteine ligase CoaBC [Bacillus carboniphilus]WLR43580.1 bifunctional phosphopantothenoylcysteine decarboxylase/phosphopantothenate--cysteine ligase CoaBC [Bacillus carboniphilus]